MLNLTRRWFLKVLGLTVLFKSPEAIAKVIDPEDNPKGLPVLEFNEKGYVVNAHEALNGIPYIFTHRRLRRTRAWLRKKDAVSYVHYSQYTGERFWGEVELVEEQAPNTAYTFGCMEKVKETKSSPSRHQTWYLNDESTRQTYEEASNQR